MKKLPPRAENLRRALAQEAARIMSEHGIRDFLTAKRFANTPPMVARPVEDCLVLT